jgi:hypothetical protein
VPVLAHKRSIEIVEEPIVYKDEPNLENNVNHLRPQLNFYPKDTQVSLPNMGQTNIRSATELLSQARCSLEQVAIIPEAGNRGVQLEPRSRNDDELKAYVAMLNLLQTLQKRWMQSTQSVWTQDILKFGIPKATLTPGLAEFWAPIRWNRDEEYPQPEGLVFVAIVKASLEQFSRKYTLHILAERSPILSSTRSSTGTAQSSPVRSSSLIWNLLSASL